MIREFGKTKKGEEAKLYILQNNQGMEIAISDYGASLVQVLVPGEDGERTDVVLGYDDVRGYEAGDKFFGATVGRIANRIGGAAFSLNGKVYHVAANDNKNNLHSGPDFYSKRMWKVLSADSHTVVFSLHSPDMDQGYPGSVDLRVSYELTEENEVKISYHAVPEQDTIINMTNHSYFNLDGHSAGTILEQEAWIDADGFTRADKESIPTGEIVPVEGTPMDFRKPKPIGCDIEADYEAIRFGKGYDHNWALNGSGFRRAAALASPKSQIIMEVYTDLPGMQVYTSNFIEDEQGKDHAVYKKNQAVCFETQYFPDAVNKEQFEGPVVRAGQVYETTTVYRFI